MNSALEDKLERIETKLDKLLSQREFRGHQKRVHVQLSSPHKNALRKVHKRLMEDFHLESEIDNLIQHDVIGRETWDEIKCLGTRANQLRMFLLKLGSYDVTKFEAFLDVLRESHSHIADELIGYMADTKGNDDILYEDDRMEVSCIRCEISKRVQPEEVIDELFSSGIIGATALRKYIEPNSEFKGSKVWKYVFNNLKSLQRNKFDVSKMMQEVLVKKYSDIAESRQLRMQCSWDCTCEAIDASTQGRIYSISDASSVIARKCDTRSNTPEILFETPFSSKRSEEQLTELEENVVSSDYTRNPEIVVTCTVEENVSSYGNRTESGYFDVDTEDSSSSIISKTITEQLLRPPETESTAANMVGIPNTYQRKEEKQEEITYKNPCYDGFISSSTDYSEKHKIFSQEKSDLWRKVFPNRQGVGESGESVL